MVQAHAPDSFEDAGPHPGLKPQVAGAPGTVLPRNHLPLTAGSQDVENAVEHRAVRHTRSPVGPRRLVGWQKGFDQLPQVLGNLTESVPLLGFSSHRESSMTTPCFHRSSRPTVVRGFRTHSKQHFQPKGGYVVFRSVAHYVVGCLRFSFLVRGLEVM